MIYYKEDNLTIRTMVNADIIKFVDAFAEQKWQKPIELFESYYNKQQIGQISVIIAEVNNEVAGYVTLLPAAEIGPFASQTIPEIVDLNVLIKFQNKGIGNKMMNVAENLAKVRGETVSLAVGLHNGYGSAQRMYIKRGYLPDGTGVWYKGKQLEQYSNCVNDDDLNLYFLKQL